MAGSFEINMAAFAKKANGNMDLVLRKITLDLLRRVVMKTPVDTGRARGNWQIGRGKMPEGETGKLGADDSIAAGAPEALQAKMGEPVFLVNHVPYILELERGSSKQAPNGMVATTLREYPGIVEKAATDTRRGS